MVHLLLAQSDANVSFLSNLQPTLITTPSSTHIPSLLFHFHLLINFSTIRWTDSHYTRCPEKMEPRYSGDALWLEVKADIRLVFGDR